MFEHFTTSWLCWYSSTKVENSLFFFFFFSFQVKARLQKMGALSPMNIFLRQEIDRMQRVITAVRQTLTDLKLAIDGTIIMSEVSFLLFWLFGIFVKFYLSLKNQRIIKWPCGQLSPILGLQKTELIKCFCLFLCVFYLQSCRWSGEVPIASLSNNEHDDIENVTKRNYSVSIWSRAICQMQVSFPGDEFLSTGLKRERTIRRRMLTSSIKRRIMRFYVVVVQWTSKKCTKKHDARAELLFCS